MLAYFQKKKKNNNQVTPDNCSKCSRTGDNTQLVSKRPGHPHFSHMLLHRLVVHQKYWMWWSRDVNCFHFIIFHIFVLLHIFNLPLCLRHIFNLPLRLHDQMQYILFLNMKYGIVMWWVTWCELFLFYNIPYICSVAYI